MSHSVDLRGFSLRLSLLLVAVVAVVIDVILIIVQRGLIDLVQVLETNRHESIIHRIGLHVFSRSQDPAGHAIEKLVRG